MFKITGKKGFHITFDNGYTVSVQFGPGNYCDNYDARIGYDEEKCGANGSRTAEMAVLGKDGDWIEHPLFGGGTVSNRSTPEQLLDLLTWASAQHRLQSDPANAVPKSLISKFNWFFSKLPRWNKSPGS